MKIVASGTSGVVVDPSDDSSVVYKLQLDERSLQSYQKETDPILWRALNSFDAEERYFVKAHPVDASLAQELFSNEFLDECQKTVVQVRQKKKSVPQESPRIQAKVLCMRKLKPVQKTSVTIKHKDHLRKGLNRLHSAGIAHLDLHRWNLMLDPENDTLKIIDFGEWAPIHEPHALTQRLEDIQALLESFIEIFASEE